MSVKFWLSDLYNMYFTLYTCSFDLAFVTFCIMLVCYSLVLLVVCSPILEEINILSYLLSYPYLPIFRPDDTKLSIGKPYVTAFDFAVK